MSFNSLLVVSSALCGVSMSGGLFYKPGESEALINPDLMFYCADTTQTCSTLFGKNVFATDDPIMDRQWTQALFPDMYNQFDDTFDCGSGSKLISMDTCSQIHQPQTLYHPTGDLDVSDVQGHYQIKWANAMESKTTESGVSGAAGFYDPFFDNSVAYWVADLADYQTVWKDMSADIIYLKWKVKSDTSELDKEKYYFSMITHNGNSLQGDGASTLSQYEMISDTFSGYENDDTIVFIESEQRAFFSSDASYNELGTGCLAYPIGVRRGVTDLEANVNWYTTIFAATITEENQVIIDEYYNEETESTVKYAHIRLYDSITSPSISFFERNDISSHGELQLKDLEDEINSVHSDNMLSPFCGIDRWFDLHYAVDFNDLTSSESILDAIMQSGEKYTLFGDSYYRFLYMPEPNGHSVQVMFETREIEFVADVNDWDPNWCPIECTDDQLSYEFGTSVVTTYGEEDQEAAKEKQGKEENVFNVNVAGLGEEKENSKTGLATTIGFACGIVAIIFGIFAILFTRADKNKNLQNGYKRASTNDNDFENTTMTDCTRYGSVAL